MNKDTLRDIWPPIIGGLVALAAALLLRSLTGTRLFAEVALDAMVDVLPGKNFSSLLGTFGPYGKVLFFVSVLVAELLLYADVWVTLRRFRRADSVLRVAVAAAAISWLVLVVATELLILLTSAKLGHGTGWAEYAFATALFSLLFASITGVQALSAAPITGELPIDERRRESRRRFLERVPGLALGGLALLVIVRVLRDTAGGGVQRSSSGEPTPEVTPNDDYYIVAKNLFPTNVEQNTWRLKVGGETQQALSLSYADMLAFPSQQQYTTMQCISNEVGGELMSNALWKGVPLKTVLEKAGPLDGVAFVKFSSADDYSECLPLDFAMRDATMLAYEMNGVPLPAEHGAPLRLLAPGKYGMKHPKWITEITLVKDEYFGYWEQQGWDQQARMNTSVRIDVPGQHRDVDPGQQTIEGVAFAGDRGISKVEVSTDDRKTWQEAALKPPLGLYTWVLWSYVWQTPTPKDATGITLWARATDGNGDLQTETLAAPFPSGATGWDAVDVSLQTASKT
ncbi:MAG TPA: molybdopterin-dependent oxidoreductase, partial [Dehalococcoidia bacterium]|nr:molybdopterin-dependent oxidoreductase [Dehalococcoidia bacterium]